jgi:hypothetical protein
MLRQPYTITAEQGPGKTGEKAKKNLKVLKKDPVKIADG